MFDDIPVRTQGTTTAQNAEQDAFLTIQNELNLGVMSGCMED